MTTAVPPTYRIAPKPTTFAGIRFRSALEAAWAERFERLGWEWTYEPFRAVFPDTVYTPDFFVVGADGAGCYYEIKGRQPTHAEYEKAIAFAGGCRGCFRPIDFRFLVGGPGPGTIVLDPRGVEVVIPQPKASS